MAEKIAAPEKADLRAQIAAELEKNAPSEADSADPPALEGDAAEPSEVTADAAPDEEKPADEESPSEEGTEEKAADKPADAKLSKSWALVAKKEAEARKIVETGKAQLARDFEQARAVLAQERTQMQQDLESSVQREFLANPIAFAKRMGVKAGGYKDLAAQFYYEELGDAAPPEMREKRHVFGVERQLKELKEQVDRDRQQLQTEKQQMEQQRLVDNYRSDLQAGLQKLPTDARYLRQLAKAQPVQAVDFMMQAANEYVRLHPGVAPTQQALVQMVEKALGERLKPFAASLAPPKTTDPDADETEPASPRTLNNSLSGRTPPKTAPKSRDELRRQLIRDLETGKAGAD